jgi:hypothetical protein
MFLNISDGSQCIFEHPGDGINNKKRGSPGNEYSLLLTGELEIIHLAVCLKMDDQTRMKSLGFVSWQVKGSLHHILIDNFDNGFHWSKYNQFYNRFFKSSGMPTLLSGILASFKGSRRSTTPCGRGPSLCGIPWIVRDSKNDTEIRGWLKAEICSGSSGLIWP